MAKIVVFNGSPRAAGACGALIGEVTRGAKAAGGEVKYYDLNDPGFRGCQGCLYCRTHPTCSVDDMFKPVYQDISEACAVVFASPVYFATITGQATKCIDRFFPMLDGASFRPRWPDKRVALIFSQGDGNPDRFRPAFDLVKSHMRTFGWQVEETIVCAGGAPDGTPPEDLMRRAYDAGGKLCR